MADTIKGLKRTSMASELSLKNQGEDVTLFGWVHNYRNLGQLLFIDLRDRSGMVQIFFDENAEELLKEKAQSLRKEYVIAVKGTVQKRGGAVNQNLPTGEIEVKAYELRLLSKSETPPFAIEENSEANEALKLKHRYLDLRRPDLQKCIIFRHKVAKIARDYFDAQAFIEIETPMLTKSTPEGARDYVVPSRVHPGKFYALPQSPQLYKQILMISGFDRYFQIVKCFRDEDLRADRQPEFTQIDIEMSFVDMDDVISVNEGFLKELVKKVLDKEIVTPFKRMPYPEAMEKYGVDKPDLRFGMELVNISEIIRNSSFKMFTDAITEGGSVRLLKLEGLGNSVSRKEIDSFTEYVKTYRAKGLAYIILTDEGVRSSIAKFLTEDELSGIIKQADAKVNDILLIVADQNNDVVFDALGNLRVELAKKFNLIDKDKLEFLWVVDFPLFEYSEEENRYAAKHHPFTSPHDDDIDIIESDPKNARAKAYDIVLNGVEIGGGSIRIFQSDLQERMFKALGFSSEDAWARFGFLLEALKYGTPPHGGMAYGLDRLVMLLLGKDSIRDVIAFPKVQNASEMMSNAPDVIEEKQLNELNISIKK